MIRTFAFVLSLLAAATLDWTEPANARPAGASEQRLSRITIRSAGTGPAVVLIPGLGSPVAVWDDVTARIGKNHRVILVQVNGFAGTPAGDAALDNLLPGAVDELAGWLAANHIEKPAVIGHSMGGLMGMQLAAAHPAAAGKLMIVDSLPFFGLIMGPGATPDTIRPIVEQMRASIAKGGPPTEAPPHMSNSEAGRAKVVEWLRASDPKVVGEALVEDATTDFRPQLPKLAAMPVTVLYAVPTADRKLMTEQLYREAYKAVPGAKLVPVDNSEHFIMLDQPGAFATAVEAFLK
jgi:pimeloyl-ACP methyl ester carboxylesterase